MDRTEATQFVSMLYDMVLDREADPAGLAGKVGALLDRRQTVTGILAEFRDSEEFTRKRRWRRPHLTSFPRLPDSDVFVAAEVTAALFAKTATYWRTTAAAPSNVYWSVLSEDEWQKRPSPEERRVFVRTGAEYADRVLAEFAQRTGRGVADLTCLDFGCGVGRIAVHFAARVARVHAVDASEAHLAEMRENASLFGCADRVTAWPLRLPADLERVPPVDLAYSVLTLQHNTPPVIAYFVEALLRRLRPGGLAFLHSILARAGYGGFVVDDYLADPEAGVGMEEHILPRANLDEVVRRAGGEIVASRCIGGNYDAYSEEFVIRRVGGA
jgi:SAM-dependent methyltransferase